MKHLSSPLLLLLLLPIITINEVAWMGTEVSYNDEWIELKNNTQEEINLDGWKLMADDGSPEISLAGKISSTGFYLLERTDDDSNPNKIADLIYTGALSNSGENLRLYDKSGKIIDEILCQDGWTGGDNETKETMKRIIKEVEPPYVETPPLQESDEDGPQRIYPKGIIFKEIMPSPDGPDVENEWIKLYNQNDFDVNLSGWVIKDVIGRITTYTLNTKIPGLEYLILSRPETKITLNNDGDGLKLTNPNGEIVDFVNFGKASQGQSYIKTSSGWQWKDKEKLPEARPRTVEKQPITKQSETRSMSLSEKSSEISPIFVALIIALFSGVVIVYLNNQLPEHSHSEHETQNRF